MVEHLRNGFGSKGQVVLVSPFYSLTLCFLEFLGLVCEQIFIGLAKELYTKLYFFYFIFPVADSSCWRYQCSKSCLRRNTRWALRYHEVCLETDWNQYIIQPSGTLSCNVFLSLWISFWLEPFPFFFIRLNRFQQPCLGRMLWLQPWLPVESLFAIMCQSLRNWPLIQMLVPCTYFQPRFLSSSLF